MVEIVVSVAAKVSEYLVDPAVRQLGYLFNYRANIEHLSLQVEKLRDARARLQHSVDEAIGNGHIIEDDVCKWMKRADEFIQNACKFLEDEKEARKSCFNGLCPNLKSRYQLSREARKKAGVAVQILGDRQFEKDRVWGLGGVGKSTLVKQVAEQAEQEKLFCKVVMVPVFQTPDFKGIQQQIADKLGMKFEEVSEQGRADRLHQRIKQENTILIILDDLWPNLSWRNKECAGLPIAIVTVAKALKNKNVSIWKRCPATTEIANLHKHNRNGDKGILKSEVELQHLEGDEAKSLCLLCGLFSRKIASEQHHVFTHQKTTVRVEEWSRIDELQVTSVKLHYCIFMNFQKG
ncbi:hypothetical protein CK203_110795 [Vitis vinifera]|uniref:NB-ARC domain-containing protein n=1 Tax=Vitis vinifera TaxID=29760 RepID=A0A438FE78_VITVI|nr:hypothetical protein CK203_110795 [Vitis vinifera]